MTLAPARCRGFTVVEREARINGAETEIAALNARLALPILKGKGRQQLATRRRFLMERNARDRRAIANGGREAPPRSRKAPDWTRVDDARLIALIEDHRSYAEIAPELHRSAGAVERRAGRIDAILTRANGRTVLQTAALLGIDWHAVAWWISQGWLKAQDAGLNYGARIVEHEELLRFLAEEDYWHVWKPARITDNAMREWAIEERRGLTYLTTGQAADRLYLTHYRVNQLIREGHIRAVKHGPNWLIRSDWLPAEWTPDRHRHTRRAYTDRDRAMVGRWWGKRPATWIAARLGRADGSVHRLASLLGLPKLGHGVWKRHQEATP